MSLGFTLTQIQFIELNCTFLIVVTIISSQISSSCSMSSYFQLVQCLFSSYSKIFVQHWWIDSPKSVNSKQKYSISSSEKLHHKFKIQKSSKLLAIESNIILTRNMKSNLIVLCKIIWSISKNKFTTIDNDKQWVFPAIILLKLLSMISKMIHNFISSSSIS